MTMTAAAALMVLPVSGHAQRRGRGQTAESAKAGAAVDLTGEWISVVTEDWKFRMVTPRKGDYDLVPLTPAGRSLADSWDPAKDEAAGQQCKAYGAPAVMRMAGRIRVSWENDTTLKIETEAGTQTRRLQFIPPSEQPPANPPSIQGVSVAGWESLQGRGAARTGNLKVVTRNLTTGYLRKNGVPYSANAVVTEYFDVVTGAPPNNNTTYLVIDTEIYDPLYLAQPFVTSTHFKKLPANAPFTTEACSAR